VIPKNIYKHLANPITQVKQNVQPVLATSKIRGRLEDGLFLYFLMYTLMEFDLLAKAKT